ncbi:hypothetical protein HID58_090619 [Brassica napus]|uniref:Peptidase S59 domain-containing protein n=1 Tax=Brassica napus TaxID=3708 RepID=A0ABQ7XD92_BRANA|nr:hypothetical protein HID58_090619 [Brassica napus]
MFGSSNPFGQSSSSSPFGSQTQSLFGQTSNSSSNNPFAPATPFGASAPFGAQTGGSIFGGTSTGVFGAPQASSPFGSTPTFGASSSPAFGNSTPAFGASPASSPFGGKYGPLYVFRRMGSSAFGQNHWDSQHLSQILWKHNTAIATCIWKQHFWFIHTFWCHEHSCLRCIKHSFLWGYKHTLIWCIKHACLCATSTPAFGASNQHTFGATNTPAFGASPTPAFGGTGTTFGNTGFGASSTPAFGASATPAFGASSTPAFGSSSTPAFGASSTPTFGASNTSSFSFGSSPAFGQSTSAFGSSAFGSTPSPFGAQGSPFSMWAGFNPTFGSSGFGQSPFGGQQQAGSRAVPYAPTVEAETGSGAPAGKLESISAMPAYKEKSHEELRWEDYQRGDKGGPLPAGQSAGNTGFGASPAQPNPFSPSPAFGQTPANPTTLFRAQRPLILLPLKPQQLPVQVWNGYLKFGFLALWCNIFIQSFWVNFINYTSVFGSSPAFGTTTSSPLFGCWYDTFPIISARSSVKWLWFQQLRSNTTANATGNAGGLGFFGQGNFGQTPAPPSSVVLQPVPVTNPFGTLPAMPQISINQSGTSPSIQYGISSMPVVDKPVPVRISSLLTSRHLLQRRARHCFYLVPFFADDEENSSSTPKADALFIPRENPRALVIRPVQQWSSRVKSTIPKDRPIAPVQENGKSSEIATDAANHVKNDNGEVGSAEERTRPFVNGNQKSNGATSTDHAGEIDRPSRILGGHRAGKAAVVYENGADIEALLPKLRQSDYFTEPSIRELAAKERADPGYCRRVRDFVVGRQGYGSIKFMGETDVRRLDLETLVQFNNREVIVYLDESKKPAVGQGLNKPAEVTLLNIKCIDKKTGKQFTEGERVEKYKMMLKRKAEAQGAEFVSFDPVKGEWKFRVDHFSSYKLDDEDDDEA